MKRFIILSILILSGLGALSTPVMAASAVISWNANSETDLAGYKIGYTIATDPGWAKNAAGDWQYTPPAAPADPYPHSIDAGKVTTFTITSVPVGPIALSLKAYDTAGNMSAYTLPVEAYVKIPDQVITFPPINVPPGSPVILNLTINPQAQ